MPYNYTTLAEVKTLKDIQTSDTDDDAFLSNLITVASRLVDYICNRKIVGETATRYFDAERDVEYNELLLDADLLSVTTLTNGDGTVITSDQYVFMPTNESPRYGIRLKASSGVSWTYVTDPENAISVTGVWGYDVGTPDVVNYATRRIVAYLYGLRDNPFYQIGLTEAGFPILAQNMPPDIGAALSRFRREWVR